MKYTHSIRNLCIWVCDKSMKKTWPDIHGCFSFEIWRGFYCHSFQNSLSIQLFQITPHPSTLLIPEHQSMCSFLPALTSCPSGWFLGAVQRKSIVFVCFLFFFQRWDLNCCQQYHTSAYVGEQICRPFNCNSLSSLGHLRGEWGKTLLTSLPKLILTAEGEDCRCTLHVISYQLNMPKFVIWMTHILMHLWSFHWALHWIIPTWLRLNRPRGCNSLNVPNSQVEGGLVL